MTDEEKYSIYDEYAELRNKSRYERLDDDEWNRYYQLKKIIEKIDEEDLQDSIIEDRDKINKEMSKLRAKVEARRRLGLSEYYGMNQRGYYNM